MSTQTAECFSITVLLAATKVFDNGNSKKVTTDKCDIDGQPEIAIWPSKPEVLISPKVRYDRYRQNFNGKPAIFDHCELEANVPIGDSNNDRQPEFTTMQRSKKCRQVIATVTDNRK